VAAKAGNSTRIALGGVCASLCLAFMFMTGIIPFSTYVLPAFAGIFLIVVSLELSFGAAMMVYLVVAILGIFIIPDKEAAALFVLLLGYYPILKSKIERLPLKVLVWIVKFALFNLTVIGGYWIGAKVIGMDALLGSDLGKATVPILIVMANLTFFIYDFMLANLTLYYQKVLRPRIVRGGKK